MTKSWIVGIHYGKGEKISLNVVCNNEYIMSETAKRLLELKYTPEQVKYMYATMTSFVMRLDTMP